MSPRRSATHEIVLDPGVLDGQFMSVDDARKKLAASGGRLSSLP
jgi:hypothetical protein